MYLFTIRENQLLTSQKVIKIVQVANVGPVPVYDDIPLVKHVDRILNHSRKVVEQYELASWEQWQRILAETDVICHSPPNELLSIQGRHTFWKNNTVTPRSTGCPEGLHQTYFIHHHVGITALNDLLAIKCHEKAALFLTCDVNPFISPKMSFMLSHFTILLPQYLLKFERSMDATAVMWRGRCVRFSSWTSI